MENLGVKKMEDDEYYEGPEPEEDTEQELDEKIENDEISDAEEEFVEGYENDYLSKCRNCDKDLEESSEVIEEEIDGEVKRLCCEKCREDFVKINHDEEEVEDEYDE